MVEGDTTTAFDLPVSDLLLLFYIGTVKLATVWELLVPDLWHQISPIVTISNDNICLASFIRDIVERI